MLFGLNPFSASSFGSLVFNSTFVSATGSEAGTIAAGDIVITGASDLTVTGSAVTTSSGTATVTARGCMIFNDSASGDPAVAVFDFGADKTSTAGSFTITFPTADASNAVIRIA